MERGSSPDEPYRMDRNMLSPFALDSSPSDGEAPWQSDEEDLFAVKYEDSDTEELTRGEIEALQIPVDVVNPRRHNRS